MGRKAISVCNYPVIVGVDDSPGSDSLLKHFDQ